VACLHVYVNVKVYKQNNCKSSKLSLCYKSTAFLVLANGTKTKKNCLKIRKKNVFWLLEKLYEELADFYHFSSAVRVTEIIKL